MRRLLAVTALAVTVAALMAETASVASASVSASRAELSGTRLRIEGTALPNRAITVNGVVLGTSGSTGAFKLEKDPFAKPADCTVQVNDGSATATTVRLSGCTVATAPAPSPAPSPPPSSASTGIVGVTANGGHGLVTSQPAGINCTFAAAGTTGPCQASFPAGITVRLNVRPADDSKFVGWRGTPGCGKAPDVTVFANTIITCEAGLQLKF
jgi:hypothetical protein